MYTGFYNQIFLRLFYNAGINASIKRQSCNKLNASTMIHNSMSISELERNNNRNTVAITSTLVLDYNSSLEGKNKKVFPIAGKDFEFA